MSRHILEQLRAPFEPELVSWRVGPMSRDKNKTKPLAYIDARDVMNRLDDVMGTDWQCEYVPMPNGTCCCRIGLLIDGEWRWRSNGAIDIADSDKSDAREMAEKGSYSGAFKRAAVLWGVGAYLYGIDAPWVAVDQYKQIAEADMPKLRALLRRSGGSTQQAREERMAPEPERQQQTSAKTSTRPPSAKASTTRPPSAKEQQKPDRTPEELTEDAIRGLGAIANKFDFEKAIAAMRAAKSALDKQRINRSQYGRIANEFAAVSAYIFRSRKVNNNADQLILMCQDMREDAVITDNQYQTIQSAYIDATEKAA